MCCSGDYLKSMVYGGMDGIITTFAIVCAASGANKDEATIVTMVNKTITPLEIEYNVKKHAGCREFDSRCY